MVTFSSSGTVAGISEIYFWSLRQPIKKTYDENDFMSYDTLEDFNARKRWSLIIDNVIKNPEFYACMSSLNRKTFSIK